MFKTPFGCFLSHFQNWLLFFIFWILIPLHYNLHFIYLFIYLFIEPTLGCQQQHWTLEAKDRSIAKNRRFFMQTGMTLIRLCKLTWVFCVRKIVVYKYFIYMELVYLHLVLKQRFWENDGNIFNIVPRGSSKQSDLIIICFNHIIFFSMIVNFLLFCPIPLFQLEVFFNVLSMRSMFNKQSL